MLISTFKGNFVLLLWKITNQCFVHSSFWLKHTVTSKITVNIVKSALCEVHSTATITRKVIVSNA